MSDAQYDLRLGLDTGVARSDVDNIAGSLTRLGGAADNVLTKNDRAARSVSQFGSASKKSGSAAAIASDKTDRMASSAAKADRTFRSVAKTVLAAGGAWLTLSRASDEIGRSVAVFSDIETALVGVGKTTGLVGPELQSLLGDVTDLAIDGVPILTESLLELGGASGQVGVEGSENILRYVGTFGKLTAATDLAGEDAVKTLTRLMNVQGEGPENVERLASVLVRLGNNFAASESEIAAHSSEVGRATAQFKIGSTQALAFGAALASIGTRAEGGGSAIGRTMREIQLAVSEGGDALGKFAEVAKTSAADFAERWRSAPLEAFNVFLQGLQTYGADAGAALESVGLGGDELAKVLPVLAENFEILARAQSLASEEAERVSALNEEAAVAFDTLAADSVRAQNAFNELRRIIGAELAPAIREVLQSSIAWARENRELAANLGGMLASALRGLGGAIAFVLRHTDELKALLVGLIALKVAQWSQALIGRMTAAATATAAWAQGVLASAEAGERQRQAYAAAAGQVEVFTGISDRAAGVAYRQSDAYRAAAGSIEVTYSVTRAATRVYGEHMTMQNYVIRNNLLLVDANIAIRESFVAVATAALGVSRALSVATAPLLQISGGLTAIGERSLFVASGLAAVSTQVRQLQGLLPRQNQLFLQGAAAEAEYASAGIGAAGAQRALGGAVAGQRPLLLGAAVATDTATAATVRFSLAQKAGILVSKAWSQAMAGARAIASSLAFAAAPIAIFALVTALTSAASAHAEAREEARLYHDELRSGKIAIDGMISKHEEIIEVLNSEKRTYLEMGDELENTRAEIARLEVVLAKLKVAFDLGDADLFARYREEARSLGVEIEALSADTSFTEIERRLGALNEVASAAERRQEIALQRQTDANRRLAESAEDALKLEVARLEEAEVRTAELRLEVERLQGQYTELERSGRDRAVSRSGAEVVTQEFAAASAELERLNKAVQLSELGILATQQRIVDLGGAVATRISDLIEEGQLDAAEALLGLAPDELFEDPAFFDTLAAAIDRYRESLKKSSGAAGDRRKEEKRLREEMQETIGEIDTQILQLERQEQLYRQLSESIASAVPGGGDEGGFGPAGYSRQADAQRIVLANYRKLSAESQETTFALASEREARVGLAESASEQSSTLTALSGGLRDYVEETLRGADAIEALETSFEAQQRAAELAARFGEEHLDVLQKLVQKQIESNQKLQGARTVYYLTEQRKALELVNSALSEGNSAAAQAEIVTGLAAQAAERAAHAHQDYRDRIRELVLEVERLKLEQEALRRTNELTVAIEQQRELNQAYLLGADAVQALVAKQQLENEILEKSTGLLEADARAVENLIRERTRLQAIGAGRERLADIAQEIDRLRALAEVRSQAFLTERALERALAEVNLQFEIRAEILRINRDEEIARAATVRRAGESEAEYASRLADVAGEFESQRQAAIRLIRTRADLEDSGAGSDLGAGAVLDKWLGLGSVVADMVSGLDSGWGEFIDRMISGIGQMVDAWERMQDSPEGGLDGALAGASFGAAAGGIFGGPQNYSSELGQLGGLIGGSINPVAGVIGSLVGTFVGGLISKGADEAFLQLKTFEDGRFGAELQEWEGDLAPMMRDKGKQVLESINRILDAFGGEILHAPGIGIKFREGEGWRVFVNGVRREFEDEAQATQFLIASILKESMISGLSDNVRAALANTDATSVEGVLEDATFARNIDRLSSGLSEMGIWIEDTEGKIRGWIRRAGELGISLDDTVNALREVIRARQAELELNLKAAAGYDTSVDALLAQIRAYRELGDALGDFESEMQDAFDSAIDSRNLTAPRPGGGGALAGGGGTSQLESQAATAFGILEDGLNGFSEGAEEAADAAGNAESALAGGGLAGGLAHLQTGAASAGTAVEIVAGGITGLEISAYDTANALNAIDVTLIEQALQRMTATVEGRLLRDMASVLEAMGQQEKARKFLARAEKLEMELKVMSFKLTIAQLKALAKESGASLKPYRALEREARRIERMFGRLPDSFFEGMVDGAGSAGAAAGSAAGQAFNDAVTREMFELERVLEDPLRAIAAYSEVEDPLEALQDRLDRTLDEASDLAAEVAEQTGQAFDVVWGEVQAAILEAFDEERANIEAEIAAEAAQQRLSDISALTRGIEALDESSTDVGRSLEGLADDLGKIKGFREEAERLYEGQADILAEIRTNLDRLRDEALVEGAAGMIGSLEALGVSMPVAVTDALAAAQLELARAEVLAAVGSEEFRQALLNLGFSASEVADLIADAVSAISDLNASDFGFEPGANGPIGWSPTPTGPETGDFGLGSLDDALGRLDDWARELELSQLSPLEQALARIDDRAADLREELDAAGASAADLARLEEIASAARAAAIEAEIAAIDDSLTSFLDRLRRDTQDGTGASGLASQVAARSRFEELLAAARSGDIEARRELEKAGENLLSASGAYFGSGAGFRDDRNLVITALEDLLGQSPATDRENSPVVGRLDQSNRYLATIATVLTDRRDLNDRSIAAREADLSAQSLARAVRRDRQEFEARIQRSGRPLAGDFLSAEAARERFRTQNAGFRDRIEVTVDRTETDETPSDRQRRVEEERRDREEMIRALRALVAENRDLRGELGRLVEEIREARL